MTNHFLIYRLPHFEDEEFKNSLIHTNSIFVSMCLLNLLVKLLFSVVLMIFKMFVNVMEPLLLVLSVLDTHSFLIQHYSEINYLCVTFHFSPLAHFPFSISFIIFF